MNGNRCSLHLSRAEGTVNVSNALGLRYVMSGQGNGSAGARRMVGVVPRHIVRRSGMTGDEISGGGMVIGFGFGLVLSPLLGTWAPFGIVIGAGIGLVVGSALTHYQSRR